MKQVSQKQKSKKEDWKEQILKMTANEPTPEIFKIKTDKK